MSYIVDIEDDGLIEELNNNLYEATEDYIPIQTERRVLNSYKDNQRILDYRIIKSLQGGNIGNVYLCSLERNNIENDYYVMKTIRIENSDSSGVHRLLKELETMYSIPFHPNVIRIHTMFVQNDIPHIVMLYIEGVTENGINYGVTLADLVNNNYRFRFSEVLWIACQICSGMAHCAKNKDGFVHGDLKPSNIFFDPIDESEIIINEGLFRYRVIAADFGIGVKTSGYYVSDDNKPAEPEDDIFAFAKTMANILGNCVDLNENGYAYISFMAGLKEMLNSEYGREVRRGTTFLSLFNAYAEAIESFLGLRSLGYAAEDILPANAGRRGFRAKVVDTLNSLSFYRDIKKDTTAYITSLLELFHDQRSESIDFDGLPVRLLILCFIMRAAFMESNIELAGDTMIKIHEMKRNISTPLNYKGVYIFSCDFEKDAAFADIYIDAIKGNTELIPEIIELLSLDNADDALLAFILAQVQNDGNLLNVFLNKLILLFESDTDNICGCLSYRIGICYNIKYEYKSALPYLKNAYDKDPDNISIIYYYAISLYSTGHVIQAMMYFERVYDIYSLCFSDYNEKVSEGILSITAFSLGYMCDYACLRGTCEFYMLMNRNTSENLKKFISDIIEASKRSEEIIMNWKSTYESLCGDKQRLILFLSGMRERFKDISHGKPVYGFQNRAMLQVFIEASNLLAEEYLFAGQFDDAIGICENILNYDISNFKAYFTKFICLAKKYKIKKNENYITDLAESYNLSKKYVHAMFPGNEIKGNNKKRDYIKTIENVYRDIFQ